MSDEMHRLNAYRSLVNKLPPENYATLAALCGHLHTVQLHSQTNLMTAHNLAVVFMATLFQELAINKVMIQLTRELIIHHTVLFMNQEETDEELITIFWRKAFPHQHNTSCSSSWTYELTTLKIWNTEMNLMLHKLLAVISLRRKITSFLVWLTIGLHCLSAHSKMYDKTKKVFWW